MKAITKCALASGWLLVGSYGCRQVIGWEEPTYWGDGGAAGESWSSSDGGSAGKAGAGGAAGMGGMAGGGGMGGVGGMGGMGGTGGMPECVTAMDCAALPNATRTCTNGLCGFTCNNGFGNCTNDPGCETALTNNRNHCGMCGNKCAAYCTGTTCNDPVSIAGGYQHHCAVMKNGDVYCWGRNEKGELGDGTLASKPVPTKVKLTSPAVQVDGGASASMTNYWPKTCAVMVNGELWCWGDGNGNPAKITGLSNVKEVSVGNAHTCAVTKTGNLYCWGSNNYGQIGDGGTGFAFNPVQVGMGMLYVSAGGLHTCGVRTNGSLECWGENGSGQLGIGTNNDQYSPTSVGSLAEVSHVRCGGDYTCALSNTSLYCWGGNTFGQLGTGGVAEQLLPKSVDPQGFSDFDSSYNFTGGITNGTVRMWGFNGAGQLGTGTTATSYSPVLINLTNAKAIALAATSSCVLSVNGEVRCWGANTYGQLGTGTNEPKLNPTLVLWP